MSKRKRSEAGGEDDDDARTTGDFRKQRQIIGAFTQSSEELAKAFKTARGFERQKLGRRKKNAANQEAETARIDAEVMALKNLDMIRCAQHFLQKSLLRIKAVVNSEELPAELRNARPFSTDAAVLNVNARLCNSNPVKSSFPSLFDAVKREFGIVDEPATGKKRRLRAKDYVMGEQGREEVEMSRGSENQHDAVEARQRASGEASNAESDDDLEQYGGLLAPLSDEESDLDFDSDIDDLEWQLEQEGISRSVGKTKLQPYNNVADSSFSDEDSSEDGPARVVAPKKSSFIPSLTMAGYISGSGSDLDDEVDIAPKKNRRGQRARQQIWEQKYGQRAKHIQNQPRTTSWDPKRGAVEQRPSKFANGANTEALGRSRQLAKTDTKKPPHKDDSGPLHPSWEAAKRAKEKNSAPVAFQGKKISFD